MVTNPNAEPPTVVTVTGPKGSTTYTSPTGGSGGTTTSTSGGGTSGGSSGIPTNLVPAQGGYTSYTVVPKPLSSGTSGPMSIPGTTQTIAGTTYVNAPLPTISVAGSGPTLLPAQGGYTSYTVIPKPVSSGASEPTLLPAQGEVTTLTTYTPTGASGPRPLAGLEAPKFSVSTQPVVQTQQVAPQLLSTGAKAPVLESPTPLTTSTRVNTMMSSYEQARAAKQAASVAYVPSTQTIVSQDAFKPHIVSLGLEAQPTQATSAKDVLSSVEQFYTAGETRKISTTGGTVSFGEKPQPVTTPVYTTFTAGGGGSRTTVPFERTAYETQYPVLTGTSSLYASKNVGATTLLGAQAVGELTSKYVTTPAMASVEKFEATPTGQFIKAATTPIPGVGIPGFDIITMGAKVPISIVQKVSEVPAEIITPGAKLVQGQLPTFGEVGTAAFDIYTLGLNPINAGLKSVATSIGMSEKATSVAGKTATGLIIGAGAAGAGIEIATSPEPEKAVVDVLGQVGKYGVLGGIGNILAPAKPTEVVVPSKKAQDIFVRGFEKEQPELLPKILGGGKVPEMTLKLDTTGSATSGTIIGTRTIPLTNLEEKSVNLLDLIKRERPDLTPNEQQILADKFSNIKVGKGEQIAIRMNDRYDVITGKDLSEVTKVDVGQIKTITKVSPEGETSLLYQLTTGKSISPTGEITYISRGTAGAEIIGGGKITKPTEAGISEFKAVQAKTLTVEKPLDIVKMSAAQTESLLSPRAWAQPSPEIIQAGITPRVETTTFGYEQPYAVLKMYPEEGGAVMTAISGGKVSGMKPFDISYMMGGGKMPEGYVDIVPYRTEVGAEIVKRKGKKVVLLGEEQRAITPTERFIGVARSSVNKDFVNTKSIIQSVTGSVRLKTEPFDIFGKPTRAPSEGGRGGPKGPTGGGPDVLSEVRLKEITKSLQIPEVVQGRVFEKSAAKRGAVKTIPKAEAVVTPRVATIPRPLILAPSAMNIPKPLIQPKSLVQEPITKPLVQPQQVVAQQVTEYPIVIPTVITIAPPVPPTEAPPTMLPTLPLLTSPLGGGSTKESPWFGKKTEAQYQADFQARVLNQRDPFAGTEQMYTGAMRRYIRGKPTSTTTGKPSKKVLMDLSIGL